MFTNHKKRVAILIESSREYGRGLLLGIARFSRVHDSWLTTHYPDRSLADGIPDWFRRENFDGVIMRIDNERSLQEICATGLPVVDLRCTFSSRAIRVETDDQQVAQLAADHLLDRGFRTIGYCGYAGAEYSERRLKFLRGYLGTRKDVRLSHYLTKTANKKRTTSMIESSAVVAEEDLVRWLLELPQPAGVIACNDVRANQILRACRELGMIVPEQLAVLGVDNDEVICDLTYPSLSSVVNDTRQIGYRAAELLDLAIDKRINEPILELISPLGVEARLSTDTNLVDDPMVARALVFIRENACRGIDVSQVVSSVPLSRATLERRFRQIVHHTINEEIRRVRLERVRIMLLESDLKLSSIAKLTGFDHSEYLFSVFKKKFGLTPGEFRQRSQKQDRKK